MTKSVGKAVAIGVGGNRNPFVAITIEVKFKEFLIAMGDSVRLAEPTPCFLEDSVTVEFSNAVATMVPAPFADLEHAVAIVGLDDTNAVPGSAQRIGEDAVVAVFKNDGSGGWQCSRFINRVDAIAIAFPESK